MTNLPSPGPNVPTLSQAERLPTTPHIPVDRDTVLPGPGLDRIAATLLSSVLTTPLHAVSAKCPHASCPGGSALSPDHTDHASTCHPTLHHPYPFSGGRKVCKKQGILSRGVRRGRTISCPIRRTIGIRPVPWLLFAHPCSADEQCATSAQWRDVPRHSDKRMGRVVPIPVSLWTALPAMDHGLFSHALPEVTGLNRRLSSPAASRSARGSSWTWNE